MHGREASEGQSPASCADLGQIRPDLTVDGMWHTIMVAVGCQVRTRREAISTVQHRKQAEVLVWPTRPDIRE